jgi:hypothetical protein
MHVRTCMHACRKIRHVCRNQARPGPCKSLFSGCILFFFSSPVLLCEFRVAILVRALWAFSKAVLLRCSAASASRSMLWMSAPGTFLVQKPRTESRHPSPACRTSSPSFSEPARLAALLPGWLGAFSGLLGTCCRNTSMLPAELYCCTYFVKILRQRRGASLFVWQNSGRSRKGIWIHLSYLTFCQG